MIPAPSDRDRQLDPVEDFQKVMLWANGKYRNGHPAICSYMCRTHAAELLLSRCVEVLNAARLGAADMDDPELLRDILVALGRKSAGGE